MAKSRNETTSEVEPFIPPSETPSEVAAPAGNDELAAKDAEIERLKAELAAAKSPAPVAAPPGTHPRWQVSLKDAASWVVEAPDASNAFDAYKRATGLLSTPHSPTITKTDAPVGRVRNR